jgi:hypothetical protein
MKKLLLVLSVAMVVFCLAIYLFIPEKIPVSSVATMNTTDNGTQRFLIDETQWNKWWNYQDTSGNRNKQANSGTFVANHTRFSIKEKLYRSLLVGIAYQQEHIDSKLTVIPLKLDSTAVEWQFSLNGGYNPFRRIKQYLIARSVKKDMDDVLRHLQNFLSKNENIYGITIQKETTKDTLYLTRKTFLQNEPGTADVYHLIKTITDYAATKKLQPVGSPIYNITLMQDQQYQLMAGVPINKDLPDANGYSTKHMVKGSFMTTDVIGGVTEVQKASHALKQYFSDYRKTSMAMNFTMLVTDRLFQPDSSKWVTKLYMPVY